MDYRCKRGLHVVAARVQSERAKDERWPLRWRAASHRATRRPNPRARPRHPAKLPIKRQPPLLSFRRNASSVSGYPRTMEDVDDAEEAELRRLDGGAPGRIAPSPFSSIFGASAPRLDAPSPLPTTTIDLTSEVSPPSTLPMVPSATSGHVQANQGQAPPQLPSFHSRPRRYPANAAPHPDITAWKA